MAQPAQPHDPLRQTDPRYGLLTPIPDRGGVPPIVQLRDGPTPQEIARRVAARDYAKKIRLIRHQYLGDVRVDRLRARGIAELCTLTDPVAFTPLIEELSREKHDVRLALLDHFAGQGDEGQAALAWLAIHDSDEGIRHEALRRMVSPASPPVLRVLDGALRSNEHAIANSAGGVAGAIRALQTIPLLIFAQATADQVADQGDLAWIAIATQRSFVARVEPVVGSGVAAFQLIPGVVQEGTVLRVIDAVAVFYRTEVHRSLVAMTTEDWGQPTAHLGYDMKAWWRWYNDQYVPFKNQQILEARLAGPQSDQPAQGGGDKGS